MDVLMAFIGLMRLCVAASVTRRDKSKSSLRSSDGPNLFKIALPLQVVIMHLGKQSKDVCSRPFLGCHALNPHLVLTFWWYSASCWSMDHFMPCHWKTLQIAPSSRMLGSPRSSSDDASFQSCDVTARGRLEHLFPWLLCAVLRTQRLHHASP